MMFHVRLVSHEMLTNILEKGPGVHMNLENAEVNKVNQFSLQWISDNTKYTHQWQTNVWNIVPKLFNHRAPLSPQEHLLMSHSLEKS